MDDNSGLLKEKPDPGQLTSERRQVLEHDLSALLSKLIAEANIYNFISTGTERSPAGQVTIGEWQLSFSNKRDKFELFTIKREFWPDALKLATGAQKEGISAPSLSSIFHTKHRQLLKELQGQANAAFEALQAGFPDESEYPLRATDSQGPDFSKWIASINQLGGEYVKDSPTKTLLEFTHRDQRFSAVPWLYDGQPRIAIVPLGKWSECFQLEEHNFAPKLFLYRALIVGETGLTQENLARRVRRTGY